MKILVLSDQNMPNYIFFGFRKKKERLEISRPARFHYTTNFLAD